MSESDSALERLVFEQVSKQDRDRYLTAMAAPQAYRAKLMAIYAFNTEVASVCDSVSETILGEIRFQWWRDQIKSAFDNGPRPAGIAGALYDTICAGTLEKCLFDKLIDSRMTDINREPPETVDELINYCEGTSSTLVSLAWQILDGPLLDASKLGASNFNETARHAGIAWALCGLIRAIPFHTTQGRCYIPQKLLQSAGLEWEYLHHEANGRAIVPLVETLTEMAEMHLLQARQLAQGLHPQAISSVLVIPVAQHYLRVLRKAAFDPYDARVQQLHSPAKTLRLMWASWRKRV